MNEEHWKDMRVAVRAIDPPAYAQGQVAAALRDLSTALDWGDPAHGPLANVVPRGGNVLIKPNWVFHANHVAGGSIEPLLTHGTLIRAVAEAALAAGAERVTVGDAPLQSCAFDTMIEAAGLQDWARDLAARNPRFEGPEDFRRTVCVVEDGVRTAFEDLRPKTDFVLFDLGEDSLLEPISSGAPQFRVTQYDPRLLKDRHHRGTHQYLIARRAIEADLVINLPKLKTHKKAGITCALKNLIGINGNKEFLPHHRLGGSSTGGDCYRNGGRVRLTLERVMDRYNMADSATTAQLWRQLARGLAWLANRLEGSAEIEGAWSGNDTIWRTCLDLNRVLLYGRLDGTMADTPQRREIHIVDAVIAGQGDGPLSPQPLGLGLLIGGASAAAVDHVGAELLHYEPARIPIVREAFGRFRWPLVGGSPAAITAIDSQTGADFQPGPHYSAEILHPEGWRDAVVRHRSTPQRAPW